MMYYIYGVYDEEIHQIVDVESLDEAKILHAQNPDVFSAICRRKMYPWEWITEEINW